MARNGPFLRIEPRRYGSITTKKFLKSMILVTIDI